jgi:hypothetical protein
MTLVTKLLISAVLGVLYSFLYYEGGVRGNLIVPLMAATLLVILPAAVGWRASKRKWLDLPLNVAMAWGTMFTTVIGIWKDGL